MGGTGEVCEKEEVVILLGEEHTFLKHSLTQTSMALRVQNCVSHTLCGIYYMQEKKAINSTNMYPNCDGSVPNTNAKLPSMFLNARHLCGSPFGNFYRLGVPEQALGGIPLDFGIAVQDILSEELRGMQYTMSYQSPPWEGLYMY